MPTVELADARRPDPDLGWLANNGVLVKMLQSGLSRGESNVKTIPGLFRHLTREDGWQAYLFADDPERLYSWTSAEFRAFIEGPRSEGGCETPLYVLERLLRDTDVWPVFVEIMRGEAGAPVGNKNAAKPDPKTINDNVIVCNEHPATIPLPVTRNPPCGNSTSYALRQLERGMRLRNGDTIPARPDLLALVRSGTMTPNAAAVEAGYRDRSITIPADPVAAARRLRKHFRGADREALIRALQADD